MVHRGCSDELDVVGVLAYTSLTISILRHIEFRSDCPVDHGSRAASALEAANWVVLNVGCNDDSARSRPAAACMVCEPSIEASSGSIAMFGGVLCRLDSYCTSHHRNLMGLALGRNLGDAPRHNDGIGVELQPRVAACT